MPAGTSQDPPGGERADTARTSGLPHAYAGNAGQTRVESLHYSCPCGAVFPARVHRVVNATRDPALGARARTGTLNQVQCPACGRDAEVSASIIYHEEVEERFILVLPESARTREMWERAELCRLLAEDATASVPAYVREPLVAYGLEGLLKVLEGGGRGATAQADLLPGDGALTERAREADKREAALAGREGALALQKREVSDGRAEVARLRHEADVRADELAKRERVLLRREEAQARRDAEVNERDARLRDREARLAERELDVNAREAQLADNEDELRRTGPVVKLPPPAPVPTPVVGAGIVPSPLVGGARPAPITPAYGSGALPLPIEEPPPPGSALDESLPPRRTTLVLTALPVIPGVVPVPAGPVPPPPAPPAEAPSDLGVVPDFADDPVSEHTVRAPVPDTGTQPKPVPSPAAVRRWLDSGARSFTALLGSVPYLAASVTADEAEPFIAAADLGVRVQLHRLPTYPLVNLIVLAGTADEAERRPLVFPLDMGAAVDRQLLEALANEFRVLVELYGPDRTPLVSREARAPLAENARFVLSVAEEHLKSVPMPQRSPVDAGRAFQAEGFDRFGRRPVAFLEDSFSQITGPAATRVAVSVIDFWSDRENEEYLVFVKAFPLPWWRRIRTRVINAALDYGIVLPGRLQTLALAQGLVPSKRELFVRLLSGASEVALQQRMNDLDPDAEAENWTALLRECDAAQVSVDPRTIELATAAQRRAPMTTARPAARAAPQMPQMPAMPGTAMPTETADMPAVSLKRREAPTTQPLPLDAEAAAQTVADLVADLDVKEERKDAALELARRGERQYLTTIFNAVKRMTRGEAIEVLPALVRFGAAAEVEFIAGLDARKSFLRQGCALALGSMKSGEAADALVKLLLEEPTEIWREVARALGDIGAPSVMSLAARIREADREGRERITLALAHVVARGGRGPVEVLAGGRDSAAAHCAQRALERAAEVQQQDEEVRGATGEVRETTMVRSFTRHFFESLAGEEPVVGDGVVELDASELVEETDDELPVAAAGDDDVHEEDILAEDTGRRSKPRRAPREKR